MTTDDIIAWDRIVDLTVVESRLQGAATCIVCADRIVAGHTEQGCADGRIGAVAALH